MSRPFFIVGCPRSGTTLLRNLLRSHPRLTVPSESHFVPGFYRAWGDPQDDAAARRLGARILSLHWVRRWELELAPADFDGCRTYADVVTRLYHAYAVRDGATRWGDKTPAYAHEIPTLSQLFPDAQFLHVVRDGRDVACSLLRTGLGPRHVYTAAHYWRAHVEAGRRHGARLGPDRYRQVRYETLLGDLETTLRDVCAFLGEPFDPRILVPSPLDWRTFPPTFGPKRAGHVSDTAIVANNAGKWRNDMPADDVALFEAVAGRLLADLGYETAGTRRIVGRAEALGWRLRDRALWLAYQLARENKRLWVPTELRLRWAALRARAVTRSRP